MQITNGIHKAWQTRTHTVFSTGPLSPWHPSPFAAPLERDGNHFEFNCAGQYILASKALMARDQEAFDAIMSCHPVADIVTLALWAAKTDQTLELFAPATTQMRVIAEGVKVVDKAWKAALPDILFRANYSKFSSGDIGRELDATDTSRLVYADRLDTVLGNGLALTDPDVTDESAWRGDNLLGDALAETRGWRHQVATDIEFDAYAEFDMWQREIVTPDNGFTI